jgi:WD40 repeat protein
MVSLFVLDQNKDDAEALSIDLVSRLTFSKNNLMESAFYFFYEGHDYISISSCDNSVHLYELSHSSSNELIFLNSLQGHTNKVKEMSFAVINGKGLLASGSLDSYIRIWAFKPVGELEESYKKSKYVYYANEKHFVMLESVLFGHTEGISGAKFFEDLNGKSI